VPSMMLAPQRSQGRGIYMWVQSIQRMLYVRSKQEKIKERRTSMPATGRAALYGRRGDVKILLNRREVCNVDKSDKWHSDI